MAPWDIRTLRMPRSVVALRSAGGAMVRLVREWALLLVTLCDGVVVRAVPAWLVAVRRRGVVAGRPGRGAPGCAGVGVRALVAAVGAAGPGGVWAGGERV